MNLYEDLKQKNVPLAVVGLGYVGMPLAVAFAKKLNVIGFDVNEHKIAKYQAGIDPTNEVGDQAVKDSGVRFTSDPSQLEQAKFHIIAVPTPVNADHTPDLRPVIGASRTLGQYLTKGSYVVYESTVFPGVTEDICIPILEEESGLKFGQDFKVGYSPERINPGDKVHRLENITKIVSGSDVEALELIAKVYELVVEVGVHRAPTIQVAEAAKVIENSQRDVNIAFMNELAMIFNRMNIDTRAVLEAAGTKWNFLPFTPGLVGGHCIGVDPYYLTYRAEQLGYHSEIILSGRRINDQMGHFVVDNLIKLMIQADLKIKTAKVAILGFTFKADVPDVRNTKVLDIYKEMQKYGIAPLVVDPIADADDAKLAYDIELSPMAKVKECQAIILAVSHQVFKDLDKNKIDGFFSQDDRVKKVLIDVSGIQGDKLMDDPSYLYWRL